MRIPEFKQSLEKEPEPENPYPESPFWKMLWEVFERHWVEREAAMGSRSSWWD